MKDNSNITHLNLWYWQVLKIYILTLIIGLDLATNIKDYLKPIEPDTEVVYQQAYGLFGPIFDVMKRGSLMYLLQESHSTSRRILHTEVKEFLTRLGAKK